MYTAADRKRALRALTQLFTAPEFIDSQRLAQADFWPDWVSRLSEEEHRRVAEVSRESQAIYLAWVAFDYEFADGRPLVDVLLDVKGERLSPGERNFLRRVRESYLGVYEIVEVQPAKGLSLRDLWTKDLVRVRERKGSRQVVRWDVLAARLIPDDSEDYVMEGSVLAFPALAVEEILRELRSAHRAFKRRSPGEDHRAFFKWIGPLLHDIWLDEVVLRPGPRFVTPEGDPVVFARVTFDVADRTRLAARLAGHPELIQHDETTYAWAEPNVAGSPRRSLGTFSIHENRLVLEAMSKKRAERGRRLLEELARDAVRFRSERYTDAGEAVRALRQIGRQAGAGRAGRPARGGSPPGRRVLRAALPELAG